MTTCLACGATIPRGPRCTRCQADHKAKYSRASGHPQLRAEWAPIVATGTVNCWRCGEPIRPEQAWDIGHRPFTTSAPEHAQGNRAGGARRVGSRFG